MGDFAEMVICDFQSTDKGIIPHIEKILFRDKTYISWQSDNPSKNEFQSRAHQTIHIHKLGEIVDDTSYFAKQMLKKINSGIIKKKEGYEFSPYFFNLHPNSLLHVVLPDLCIPNFQDFKGIDVYSKKKGERISLTWPFESNTNVKFYFHKVTKKEFDKFKTDEIDVNVVIDPQISQALQSIEREIGKKIEDLSTTTAAKYIRELSPS